MPPWSRVSSETEDTLKYKIYKTQIHPNCIKHKNYHWQVEDSVHNTLI